MAKRFKLSYAALVAVMAVVVLHMALPSISAQQSSSPGNSDEEFFRKNCDLTPYPEVCNGMVPMVSPSKVKQSLFEMVKSIVEFSTLSSDSSALLIGDMSVQVQPPGHKKGLNPSTEPQNLLEVIKGCSKSFETVDNLKSRAIKQMDQLNNPTSSSNCKAEMTNVVTWLSDAIKEEGKCLDSLEKIFDKVVITINGDSQVTSNTVALAQKFIANN